LTAVALFAVLAGAGCAKGTAEAEKEKSETILAGTTFVGSLQGTIDTGKNAVGDKIAVRTLEDVRVNEMTVVPAGATINGEVTHVEGVGRIKGGAELTLRFTELVMPDGKSYAISAEPFRVKGKSEGKSSALQIGGGAVAGGVLGGVLGGKNDIVKGAAAGAVIGTGVAIATKGDQIVLPAGQKMKVTLDAPITIVTKPAVAS
jgi:type IV secretion system protein VirB10